MFKCENVVKSVYNKQDRIIAIGDLHGDYDRTISLFRKLELIDINNYWIAKPKKTFVVQLGDQLDGGGRGGEDSSGELKLIQFMEDINKKAMAVGGAVLSLIGNHEVMNMLGDFRFASKNDINDLGGVELRTKLFKPGSALLNKLSCTRNVVVKIGSWIFVHAGILPKHIMEHTDTNTNLNNNEPDKWFNSINNLMRLFMQGKKTQYDADIQNIFLNKQAILWDRDYGSENPTCNKWDKTKKLLNVKNIVIGHTVQDKINSKCDNSIWRIDVGISKTFGNNNIEVLEILDDGVSLPKNKFQPIRIIT